MNRAPHRPGSGRRRLRRALRPRFLLLLLLAPSLGVGCGGRGGEGDPRSRALAAQGAEADPTGEIAIEPVTGMVLLRVEAGSFEQGSPTQEPGHEPGETQHAVRLARPFFLGRSEVTQAQWRRVMGTSPSHFADCGEDCPVESVNALEVEEFLRRLTALQPGGVVGIGGGAPFRLPTEAEWEYACRAGTTTPFSTGATLGTDRANYNGRFPYPGSAPGLDRGRPTPAGTFAPNPWGFLDLHGNVWEWVADEHCPYPTPPAGGAVVDPLGRCGADLRVIRGGSWYFNEDSARCAVRYTHRPVDRGFSLGFRVALDA